MTDFLSSRYRLIEVVGQGAMGKVWRAQDSVLDREVALKELHAGERVDPTEAMDRFLVEARAAARLSHPNIVAVYDVFADGERVLIAMELVRGPTLAEVVRTNGAMSPATVRAIMFQVAQALSAAHGAGVVHRDLKPDNIFWTPNGRAVVTDFGLARIGVGTGTIDGTVMGTPGYMAPEQVRGLAVGPPADVFAWGAVAYELATGRAPFGDASATDPGSLAYRIVHEGFAAPDLPDDVALARSITASLAKDPADRPGDGSALVAALMVSAEAEPYEVTTSGLGMHGRPQADAVRTAPSAGWAGKGDATGIRRRHVVRVALAATLGVVVGLVAIPIVLSRTRGAAVSLAGNSALEVSLPIPSSSIAQALAPRPSGSGSATPDVQEPPSSAPEPTAPPGTGPRLTAPATTGPPTTVPTTVPKTTVPSTTDPPPTVTTAPPSSPTTSPPPRTPAVPTNPSARNEPVACAAVVGLDCKAAIRVTWTDNSTDESGFEVSNGVDSRTVEPNSGTYIWSAIAHGTTMCFRVRAYNGNGASEWIPSASSNSTCATTS